MRIENEKCFPESLHVSLRLYWKQPNLNRVINLKYTGKGMPFLPQRVFIHKVFHRLSPHGQKFVEKLWTKDDLPKQPGSLIKGSLGGNGLQGNEPSLRNTILA